MSCLSPRCGNLLRFVWKTSIALNLGKFRAPLFWYDRIGGHRTWRSSWDYRLRQWAPRLRQTLQLSNCARQSVVTQTDPRPIPAFLRPCLRTRSRRWLTRRRNPGRRNFCRLICLLFLIPFIEATHAGSTRAAVAFRAATKRDPK